MTDFRTAIDIHAPPESVWSVVSRPDQFPDWSSGVLRVDGAGEGASVGQKIRIESVANPGKSFPVTVVEVDPPHRMVLRGGMPLGLFTGTRTYQLEPLDDARTRFTMNEDYTGPLAGLVTRSIPDLQPSFDTFAAGLKDLVEPGDGR